MSPENSADRHIFGLPKAAIIAGLIGLSCYYFWVLYLAATPKVTPAYQTYYINTETLYWGKDNHGLAIGVHEIIDVTQKTPFISREGWDKVAKDNQRGLANNAGLYFSFTDPQVKTVRLELLLAQPQQQPVSVEAQLDGQLPSSFTWVDDIRLHAEIPITGSLDVDAIHHIKFALAQRLQVRQISVTPVKASRSTTLALNEG